MCCAGVGAARRGEPAAGGEGGAGERAGHTDQQNAQTGELMCDV